MTGALAHDGRTRLVEVLLGRLAERDAFGIIRLEERRARSAALEGTRVEAVESSFSCGLGVQAFTASGRCGFAAVDDPDEERGLRAVDRAVDFARAGDRAGLAGFPDVLGLAPTRGREAPDVPYAFEHLSVGAMRDAAAAFAAEVAGRTGGVQAQTAFSIGRADWRIVRSDGTDVSFRIPRSFLGSTLTARRDGEAARAGASDAGTSWEVLLDPERRGRLLARAERAGRLALDLLDAEPGPEGSFRILIDFALAKGLAHEAFGHAAESDALDSSILGDGGRFRAGERFGSPRVTIVDESLAGDNAYQPFSGNGERRLAAVILDRGTLRDALADVHTAGRAGTRGTGAGRLMSFAHVPVPRMSNIRLEVEDPWPTPEGRDFYDWTPEEVRDLLVSAGDLAEGERVMFLSGYRGGQVNPALGDFVFHSTALYELRRDGVRLYKPGIFSGRIEAALHAIRRGYGPLRLDAAGTCGKAGQGVPSSGGSHHFLLLEEDPDVRIGGRR